MIRGHYDANKIQTLCNFIDVKKVEGADFQKKDYYCFLGAIRTIKGVKTLCRAATRLPYKLVLIGSGELLEELRELYWDYKNIEFVGQKTWSELRPIIEHARFSVLPSECAENNPLSVIEAQSLGTPVLGARIGGIPELIEENVSGLTFTSGNVEDLTSKIQQMWDADFDYEAIAKDAVARYSSEAYYEKLMEIYCNKTIKS